MKRALLVDQTVDGNFRLPLDTPERTWTEIQAEADSTERISALTEWWRTGRRP
jgi:hypothetical protein